MTRALPRPRHNNKAPPNNQSRDSRDIAIAVPPIIIKSPKLRKSAELRIKFATLCNSMNVILKSDGKMSWWSKAPNLGSNGKIIAFLKKHEIEYYTHGLKSDRTRKVILKGLDMTDLTEEDVINEMKNRYNIVPTKVITFPSKIVTLLILPPKTDMKAMYQIKRLFAYVVTIEKYYPKPDPAWPPNCTMRSSCKNQNIRKNGCRTTNPNNTVQYVRRTWPHSHIA